jgi:hypothetical protein
LERLGFPWILSFKSSIFNGLRWIFAEGNFSRPFAAEPELWESQPTILACGKGRIGHAARVIQFLLFCKKLPSEPFSFWPPPSNSKLALEDLAPGKAA